MIAYAKGEKLSCLTVLKKYAAACHIKMLYWCHTLVPSFLKLMNDSIIKKDQRFVGEGSKTIMEHWIISNAPGDKKV